MNKKYNREMIKILSEAYNKRLNFFLEQMKVHDKDGNSRVGQALKVKHEESGIEYTVSGLVKNEKGEELVKLKLPEYPRDGLEVQDSSQLVYELDSDIPFQDDKRDLNTSKSRKKLGNDMNLDADRKNLDGNKSEYILVPIEKFEEEYDI
tara:strand:- start:4542 stop:4991 length:450 start_codon:yes stop_codon:yes gene_type:complete